MKFINKNHRIPIFSWCEPIEDSAFTQAINLTKLPCVYKQVALMPDCHEGFGMPIGGVIACDNAVVPNAVGVDIGCGMCAVQTDFPASELDSRAIAEILREIKQQIPVGFAHHKTRQPWDGFNRAPDISIIQQELKSAESQLGTLGGGNHFIEIQKSNTNQVWLMVHSGSRNFGYKIANVYHKKALSYCTRKKIDLPDKDLAWFPMEESDAREYFSAMNYALEFAHQNRQCMKEWCTEVFVSHTGCSLLKEVNIHHNFASEEEHFNKKVIVHRKGATSARAGQQGIIPGSMGTASYIVQGLGNPDSFESCSHGAGRIMGRNDANRRLSLEEANLAMKGIVFEKWSKDRKGRIDLSEAPQAYKNIENVMASQTDLVAIVTRLEPMGVVKG
jgi:tRNA-splicing ligase RtcB (3'-phosphate/5'-hydroxy nucleic acid ligase)